MMHEEEHENLLINLNLPLGYLQYSAHLQLYEEYLEEACVHINNRTGIKNIIILFLESGPSPRHKGNVDRNYIFNNLDREINKNHDNFLWNICKGFDINPQDCTKHYCLNSLITRDTPVIIMDLFPFHGINLSRNRGNITIRRSICDQFMENQNLLMLALTDPRSYIQRIIGKKINTYFLFGVPGTIWNCFGGAGRGSLYHTNVQRRRGPLGCFHNNRCVVNVGGQTISSHSIRRWRQLEFPDGDH